MYDEAQTLITPRAGVSCRAVPEAVSSHVITAGVRGTVTLLLAVLAKTLLGTLLVAPSTYVAWLTDALP